MDTISEETVLTSWKEALPITIVIPPRLKILYVSAGILLIVIFIALGFFFKEWTLYVAAPVGILAMVAIYVQNKRQEIARTITLTNQRIILGEQTYILAELSGFWLQPENEALAITLEYKRPTVVPATCFFENSDESKARQTLRQALSELEPRRSHFTDSLSRYFHF